MGGTGSINYEAFCSSNGYLYYLNESGYKISDILSIEIIIESVIYYVCDN